MSVLLDVKDYEDPAVKICPNGTEGEIIELGGLLICLPERPPKKEISGYKKSNALQVWGRIPMPKELSRISSMDEWEAMPREFRARFHPYVEEEFRRRREGFWFYNNNTPIYITGRHYMMLQWTKLSFILSAVVLGIPIYALLYLSMRARKLKTSLWGYNLKQEKTPRKTYL